MKNFRSRLKKAEQSVFGSSEEYHVIKVRYGEDEDEALQRYEDEKNVRVGPGDLEVYLMPWGDPDTSFEKIEPRRVEKTIHSKQESRAEVISDVDAEVSCLLDDLKEDGMTKREIAVEISKEPEEPVQEQEFKPRPEVSELTRLMGRR